MKSEAKKGSETSSLAHPGEPAPKASGLVFATLALLVLLTGLLHALTYLEPYQKDECLYAVIARELLRGRALYTGVWDDKPPGIFLTYAAAIALFGYGRAAIFALAIGASALTVLGVYLAVKTATGSRIDALWAAAFWAIISCNVPLEANQPNCEAFMNALTAFAVWALFVAYAQRASRGAGWWFALSGAFWALSTYLKQVAIAPAFLLGLAAGFTRDPDTRRVRWRARPLLCTLAPILALWTLTALYFLARGRWWDFEYVNFIFPRSYVHGYSWMASEPVTVKLAPASLRHLWPLGALCALALIREPGKKGKKGELGLWIVLLVATEIAVFLPGQFFDHYYQLQMVPLCIGAGLALAAWRPRPHPPFAATVATLLLLAGEWPFWTLSPDDVSNFKYGPLPALTTEDAIFLGQFLRPNERVYVYGAEPEYYLWTQKSPPDGMVSSLISVDNPPLLTTRTLSDLRRHPPDFVILDRECPVSPISEFLSQNYVIVRNRPPYYDLVRKNGPVIRRLRRGGG